MNRYQLRQVGVTKKAVGFDGGIRLDVDEQYLNKVISSEAIWITKGYETIPFFVKSIDDDLIVIFEEIETRESVTELAGKSIFLLESDLGEISDKEDSFDLDALIGLKLFDGAVEVGEILRIDEYPQQVMLVIEVDAKEKLIPFHESLIVNFIPEERLEMNLPEGLLDI